MHNSFSVWFYSFWSKCAFQSYLVQLLPFSHLTYVLTSVWLLLEKQTFVRVWVEVGRLILGRRLLWESNNSASDQGCSSGGGKNWLTSRYILNVEPMRFPDGFGGRLREKSQE